jgi:putative aldouronate transport system permease protein
MKKKDKAKKKKKFMHWLPFYLMGLPGMLYLLINNYLPMFGLQIAFKSFSYNKGILESPWNNFKNFTFLFKSKDAFIMIRNTVLYNVLWIILGIILGVILAILLNEIKNKIAARFYQTVILLPFLMSMVIVAYLVYEYLSPTSGLLSSLVEKLTGEMPQYYMEKGAWPFILTIVQQWKQIGFGMILYFASLVGIDNSYYEAAKLDGASRFRQHRHITIPLLKTTILMLLIINMGQVFRSDFGLFFQVPMNQGALFDATQTIDTYVYRHFWREVI